MASIKEPEVYKRIHALIPATEDQSLFSPAVMQFAVEAALLWHSRYKPKNTVSIGTGDGAETHFAFPDDFIAIKRVESEWDQAPPEYLSTDKWMVHQGTAGQELVFSSAPGSGDLFGIHYQGTWTLDDLSNPDIGPLSYLASAYLCMREAARTASTTNPLIDADVIDYRMRSAAWPRLKDHFIGLYAQSQGLSAKAVRDGAPPLAYGVGTVPAHHAYRRWFWRT